jgi:hypothetical protein
MKMKIKNIIVLFFFLIFFNGCGSKEANIYRTKEFNLQTKPIATVEKAWQARHKYDHERRLLIPMVGGTRWGAVQEYKANGTLEYKDWWVRDVKKEDLEAAPSTKLRIPQKKISNKKPTLDNINIEDVPVPIIKNADVIPPDLPSMPTEVPNAFPLENSEIPMNETPFAPLPFDSVPSLREENSGDSASPFAPLPDAFSSP